MPFLCLTRCRDDGWKCAWGKFGLADFFDQNSVGSDSHFQFTNWTVDQTGAWDFAADTRGYTVGVTADYEDRN